MTGLILSVSLGARSIDRAAVRNWRAECEEIPNKLVYAVGHYVRRRVRGLPGCARLAQPYQQLIDADDELSAFFAAVTDWSPIAAQATGYWAARAGIPKWREIGRSIVDAVTATTTDESGLRVAGAPKPSA